MGGGGVSWVGYRGFFGGGGDIEVFIGGGDKVLREKTRVQSPESRVQSPGSRVQSSF